jgi:hypothetical protein
VIRKLGMKWEGRLREHDLKWGTYEDIDVYAILAKEWQESYRTPVDKDDVAGNSPAAYAGG